MPKYKNRHTIICDHTRDEHGHVQYGWWCDDCEEGGFASSLEARADEVYEHRTAQRTNR